MRKIILALMVLALCMPTTLADACFCVAIGKDASPTGYPIVIHNEDDGATDVISHYWVPASDDWLTNSNLSDDFLPAATGRAQNIPQVAKTLGFYMGEAKGVFGAGLNSACGMLNEYGVSVMSNQCGSNVSATQAVLRNGGLWWNLRRCIAERGTSARHTVEIVTQLLNDWGYSDSGRTYTIGDYKEVWLVHVSRGQQYVATRVPDDHIAVMPNHYTIDQLDEYAPTGPYGAANSNTLYRSDLLSWTRTTFPTRFPAASADASFNWRSIYRSGNLSTGNTRRQSIAEYNYFGIPISSDMTDAAWHAARPFKFSNKMNGRATIEMIFKTHTSHFEGTSWNTSTPGSAHVGGVCASGTIESKIVQFHPNLKLTTLWTALGRPCALPYIPLHPLAYGADIEKMVPEAVQYTAAEASHRLASHFSNLRDHKLFWNNRQDNIRKFKYMLGMAYGQHYTAVIANNANYLYEMFEANKNLIAGNPSVETLASFDRAASDKALKMQQDYMASTPLFGVPVFVSGDYIDRNNATQTQVDIIFDMPTGKTPSATNLRLTLSSVAATTANIVSGSLQNLSGDRWKFTMTKATLTGSSLGTGGNPGFYQFILGGQTTASPAEYFTGSVVLNFSDGPVNFALNASPLTTFASAILDRTYTPPAAQSVLLTNIGTSPLILNQPTSAYYDVTKVSEIVLTPGKSISFDVRPKAGLAVGAYNETIKITGTNVSADVDAKFTVVSADYIISVTSVDLVFANVQAPSYTQPAAQTVTIRNNGTGVVTLTQPTATSYDIGNLSTTNLAVSGTATFTVRPRAGLSPRTYVETINITGNNGARSAVVATFTVTSADISATPVDVAFPDAQAPSYTPPAAQTVTIRNNGTGAVTLNQPTSTNYDIGALSATNVAANGTVTFTIRPKAGLSVRTYTESINITGSGGASCFAVATFTVIAEILVSPDTYIISASENTLDFDTAKASDELPAAQTVTITNIGTGAVTLDQPTAADFDCGTLSAANLAANASATFTVRPKADLAVGTYIETITITGSNGVSTAVEAKFVVDKGSSGGGSGGCSMGFAFLGVLAIAGLILRRRF